MAQHDAPDIRRLQRHETGEALAVVNAAAEAYRGVIPDDCWHEPYMSADELDREIAAGVEFWAAPSSGAIAGVMGVQAVRDVRLIRHAYVRPTAQGQGLGGVLLRHLTTGADAPILVGTWAAAHWAIRFYERHGFRCVPADRAPDLLRTYWTVSPRQIETSVVLARGTPSPNVAKTGRVGDGAG